MNFYGTFSQQASRLNTALNSLDSLINAAHDEVKRKRFVGIARKKISARR